MRRRSAPMPRSGRRYPWRCGIRCRRRARWSGRAPGFGVAHDRVVSKHRAGVIVELHLHELAPSRKRFRQRDGIARTRALYLRGIDRRARSVAASGRTGGPRRRHHQRAAREGLRERICQRPGGSGWFDPELGQPLDFPLVETALQSDYAVRASRARAPVSKCGGRNVACNISCALGGLPRTLLKRPRQRP